MSKNRLLPAVKGSPEKEKHIKFSISPDGLSDFHFFNRYSIRKVEGGALIDFGLSDGSAIISSVTMLFSSDAFTKQKSNIEDYFGRLAQIEPKIENCVVPKWSPGSDVRDVVVADFLGLSQVGNEGSVDVYSVPLRKVSNIISAGKSDTLNGIPILGLRSTVMTHKAFLHELISEEWSK